MQLHRREFLKLSAAMAGLLGATPPTVEVRNEIPYRVLGETGEKVSLLGVGGSHIGEDSLTDEEVVRLMRTAVDEGINFFDNAWIYKGGRSEERMGMALRDGYRDKVFLMTKQYTNERDAESVMPQLEESLRRLQTDHIDLYQVHQIHEPDHARKVYENGIPEILVKAREQGKIRYIGFTGHSRPEFHREMIDRGFQWDTVQMPVNPMDHFWTSFEDAILPLALQRKIAVIGMKSLGGSPGRIANDATGLTAEECLRYAMSMPVATVVSGMDSMQWLEENLRITRGFQPLEEAEIEQIRAKAQPSAKGGACEPYKWKELA